MKQLRAPQFVWGTIRNDIIKAGPAAVKDDPGGKGIKRVVFTMPLKEPDGAEMEACYNVLVKNGRIIDVFSLHLRNGKRVVQRCSAHGDAHNVLSRMALRAAQEKTV